MAHDAARSLGEGGDHFIDQVYNAYTPFSSAATGGIAATVATANYEQFEAWIQGYLVGVQYWSRRAIRGYDRAGMQLWIYNYCQQRPLDMIVNPAFCFYQELVVTIEH